MLLGIICNQKQDNINRLQAVNHMYLSAVSGHMNVQPVLIPAHPDGAQPQVDALLDRLDGVLMTGNRSNVHPSHYGVEPSAAHEPYEPGRDITALAIIKGALERDMPLLAICRGYQELNVACGGTLMTDIHLTEGRFAHLTPDVDDNEERFAARHDVHFVEGGYFHTLLGVRSAKTNSLHWQAIDKLADPLEIEGHADDGIIEAVRHKTASYCIGVQWHPEYQSGENIVSAKLFGDFDRAMLSFSEGRVS